MLAMMLSSASLSGSIRRRILPRMPLNRQLRLLGRIGVDHIHDRFSLRQINAAVEESPAGKFPRIGKPCAFRQHQRQNSSGNVAAAMPADFHNVFACKSFRRAENRQQHLVDSFLTDRIDDIAIPDGMRRADRPPGRLNSRPAIARLSGPLIRITEIAPSCNAVEIAAIVSFSILSPPKCSWYSLSYF